MSDAFGLRRELGISGKPPLLATQPRALGHTRPPAGAGVAFLAAVLLVVSQLRALQSVPVLFVVAVAIGDFILVQVCCSRGSWARPPVTLNVSTSHSRRWLRIATSGAQLLAEPTERGPHAVWAARRRAEARRAGAQSWSTCACAAATRAC
jgi:hypothetical protein